MSEKMSLSLVELVEFGAPSPNFSAEKAWVLDEGANGWLIPRRLVALGPPPQLAPNKSF